MIGICVERFSEAKIAVFMFHYVAVVIYDLQRH